MIKSSLMVLRVCIWIVALIFFHVKVARADAYPVNGIYLTEKDFVHDVLTNPSLQESDNLIEEWGGDISLLRNGNKLKYKFGAFYGYRAGGFKFFSFGKRETFGPHGYFQILDTSCLVIYSKRVSHVQYKYVAAPYFSVSGSENKYKLTVKNVKKYIPMHQSTFDKIRGILKSGRSLDELIDGRCAINVVMNDSVVREFLKLHPKSSGRLKLL